MRVLVTGHSGYVGVVMTRILREAGHKDILTKKNSLQIETLRSFDIKARDGTLIAKWDDPDLDEVVSKLEWAYLNKDQLQNIGAKASETLSSLTWRESARQFHKLIFGEETFK